MSWYRLYHLGSDGQHVAPEDLLVLAPEAA